MKVLLVNTSDKGGAATALIRIHKGLIAQGIESKLLVLHKTGHIEESYVFRSAHKSFPEKLRRFLMRSIRKLSGYKESGKFPGVEWFSSPLSNYDITTHPLYDWADIVMLNWVSGFLDEPSFFSKNTKPVVWRMPDLYCCGGGYHYEKGFPFEEYARNLKRNLIIRQAAFKDKDIHFVAISNWVADKARSSPLIGTFPISTIHNGIDTKIFKPLNKTDCRQHYGLPEDKTIVLLGAHRSSSFRKGMQLAVDALKAFSSEEILPVVFGFTDVSLPDHFREIGYVSSEHELAKLYSAADYFLMSSIEEAFGQVTIEAIACGLPVISFPNGGSLDILTDATGVIADGFETEDLTNALEKGLNTKFDREQIRDHVLKSFRIGDRASDYYELFCSCLEQ
jgi:glycosyltransferase involved in cell wall biosynthesis